jgi:hypothetical protein
VSFCGGDVLDRGANIKSLKRFCAVFYGREVAMTALEQATRTKIEAIIDGMLQQYDLETCGIEVARDSSGDEAIFIDICYRLNAIEFDASAINAVRSAVRSMLIENGEERFPYIRHHLPSGQKVKAA